MAAVYSSAAWTTEEDNVMRNSGGRFDAILLLGLELGENDEPAQELCIRVKAAVDAYRALPGVKIIACGGITEGHRRSEAEVMAQLLMQAGVPQEDILLENESQTTIENFINAARMLGDAKGKRVLVVTSDYHVRRSVLTARRAGLSARGFAAVLEHDETWKNKKARELGYTVDMLMGWQDAGKTRPQWTYRLFDLVFGRKG